MNTNKYILSALLIALGFISTVNAQFSKIEKEKTIEKAFDINSEGTLVLANKYGGISIDTWDKQAIQMKIVVTVVAGNEANAQKFMDLITIDFTNTADQVSAKTVISEGNVISWGGKSKYEIHYEVLMPKNVFLDVSNTYGNVQLASINRDIKADVRYGNLTMDVQTGDLDLDLKYAKATIESVKNFEGEIDFSELYLLKARVIDIESKYSTIEIENVESIDSESAFDEYNIKKVVTFNNDGKYDEISIEQVGVVNIDTKYSTIRIDKLFQSLDIDQRYSEVDIRSLDRGVSNITIDAQYSEIKIDANQLGYNLNFEGQLSEYYLSKNFNIKDIKKDFKDVLLNGAQGDGRIPIKLELNYSEIIIK